MAPEHCVSSPSGTFNGSRRSRPAIPGQHLESNTRSISGISGSRCLLQLLQLSMLRSANALRLCELTALARMLLPLANGKHRTRM